MSTGDNAQPTGPAGTAVQPVIHDPALPAFEETDGGYHKGQVDDFIHRLLSRLRQLEQHVGHEAGTILKTAARSPEAPKLVSDLMKLAAAEVTQNQAAAEAEVAQVLADARIEAEQILQAARDESDRVAAGAREQSETVLTGARAEARRMTSEAAAHSAAVSEGAAQRLQVMIEQHEAARHHLAQVHEVTGRLLSADAERGGLDAEAQRALTAAGQPPLPLPAGTPEEAPEAPQDAGEAPAKA